MVSHTPFNAKQFGGTVEAIFRAEAAKQGYHPFDAPSGDYLPIDAIVYNLENRKSYRVQVKATSSQGAGSGGRGLVFRIPIQKGRGGTLKHEHLDVVACYVQPFDTWYLIPAHLCTGSTLKFYPHVPQSKSKFAPFRDEWSVFNT